MGVGEKFLPLLNLLSIPSPSIPVEPKEPHFHHPQFKIIIFLLYWDLVQPLNSTSKEVMVAPLFLRTHSSFKTSFFLLVDPCKQKVGIGGSFFVFFPLSHSPLCGHHTDLRVKKGSEKVCLVQYKS